MCIAVAFQWCIAWLYANLRLILYVLFVFKHFFRTVELIPFSNKTNMNSRIFYNVNHRFCNLNVYMCNTKSTMSISAPKSSTVENSEAYIKSDNALLFIFTVEISCYVRIDNYLYSEWCFIVDHLRFFSVNLSLAECVVFILLHGPRGISNRK